MTARFHVGDAVRTLGARPAGHTRLPGYLCGRRGTVESVHGPVPVADDRAQGHTARAAPPETLYTVLFDGRDVWDRAASPAPPRAISADLWDRYLEPDAP